MNADSLAIRYIGADSARRFTIQRGDGFFWTGKKFSRTLAEAELFQDHRKAQLAVGVINYEQHKGKPIRTFKCEVSFTVVGHAVKDLTAEQLVEFLLKAVRIDVDTGVHGDGPSDLYLLARMKLAGLEETQPVKKFF